MVTDKKILKYCKGSKKFFVINRNYEIMMTKIIKVLKYKYKLKKKT
jgi:hypothetical protein